MAIKGMTAFEESILTDEERSALEQGDADDAKAEAADAAPTGTPDEPVTEMVGDDDADDDVEEGEKAAETEDAPGGTADAESDEAKDEPAQRRESTTFVMPESADRNFAEELKELAKKFEDGEITTQEFGASQAAIITAQAKAEVARDINDAQWSRDVKRFLRDNSQYRSPVLYSALNAALSEVNKDPANSSLDGDELLDRAHALVSKEFGVVPPKAGLARTRPLPKPGEAEAKAIKAAPKTLADVPAADDASTGADRYVHLDRLDGMSLEQALAKMPEAEAEAYLAGR